MVEVEQVLCSIESEARYGDNMGGDYFTFGRMTTEHYVIRYPESDDDEGTPVAEEASFSSLLEIQCTLRGEELRTRLSGIDDLALVASTVW